jgi:hypothetical protein
MRDKLLGFLFTRDLLKESWASYVGWYLGELYYSKLGYTEPMINGLIYDHTNDYYQGLTGQARQYWERTHTEEQNGNYSPLLIDLIDDFNQAVHGSGTLNYDAVSNIPRAVIYKIANEARTWEDCRNILDNYIGTYYTSSEFAEFVYPYDFYDDPNAIIDPVITGPEEIYTYTPETYNIPSATSTPPLPDGWIFFNWGVLVPITNRNYKIADAHSPNTTFTFFKPGDYTIWAGFDLPDGTKTLVEKTVRVKDLGLNTLGSISGSTNVLSGMNNEYHITGTLPPGVTFEGWTVSYWDYTTTTGLLSPILNISFADDIRYTLTANFRLPDGTPHTIRKNVDVIHLGNIAVTGQDFLTPNSSTTFSIPTSFPVGLTFTDWSVSPNSGYTVSGGTTGSTFNVQFDTFGEYIVSANFSLSGNTYSVTKTVTIASSRMKLVELTGVRMRNGAILNVYDPGGLYFTDTGIREEFFSYTDGTYSYYYLPMDYIQLIADAVLSYPYYSPDSDLRYGRARPDLEYLYFY